MTNLWCCHEGHIKEMESSENTPYSGRAGNSQYPANHLQNSEDNYASNENQITQEVHSKIANGEKDNASTKCERKSHCSYDTNSETSESSDEDASDVLSGTCEESDNELMDDDNGNDENGNIKELNDESDIEEDEWESMDEDDENGEVGPKDNFDIGMDSDSSNDHSERCSVCLNRFIGQIIGTPESCEHSFCLECILEWSKNINTCPVDRRTFNQIFSRNELGGSIIEKIPISAPRTEDEPDDDVTYCEVCRQCDREDRLLLCDFCDNGYHCECLIPPLDHVPIVEWYCPRCISDGNAEANIEENVDAAEIPSRVTRIHRAIARTQASESVRHRIQQLRMANGENRPRRTITRRRKVRRRKRTTKRAKPRKYTKKQHTGIKQKCKNLVRKPRRKRRKLSRRKRKTRRAVATARPLIAPSIRKRIADRLGIDKPRPGQSLPQIKRSCPSRSLNSQRFDGGVPTVSLFGHRDDLDIVDEEYENSSTGGVATIHSRVVSHPALAPYARFTGKHALSLERRIFSASPLISTENFDVLGGIMQEQRLLHKKSHSILIQRNGCLKVKSPDDGLEQKQESDTSDSHTKSIHGDPESEEGSKTTESKNDGQSTSPNMSSNVDMFDSDNNDKHEDNIELSHSAHQTTSKGNKENKSRKQKRNILNYGALQLYSDVEDDEENESLWRPVKKKRNINADKSDNTNKPAFDENSANQSSEIETSSSSINEKTRTKNLEPTSSNNTKLPNGAKNIGKGNANTSGGLHDNKQGLSEVDSDSHVQSQSLSEKEPDMSACKSEEHNDKEKCTSDEAEKKADQNEEVTDDFTDITPRVNIAVLPKIPKIKREKDENKDEEISESGRHSVLSKVDDGSQETRWSKLSRFNRDKNSTDKTQSERSFSDHNSSRAKQENFRWSNERNRDNRHWRERDDGNWRERDDGDHYRDRRHGERQREHDRWERPWKSDQRNRFDNYNYGNDNRKKFSRDNRSSNFRDRKEFPRGRSGRSPLKEYSREKDRNLGGKGSSTERDGMYRDIPNRTYKKFASYEGVSETKKDASQITKCDTIESDITNIEKENINNDQCIDDRLLINSPLTLSSLNRKCTISPLDWEAKQHEMEEIETRENYWNMQEEEEHDPMQCDNSNSHAHFANLKDPYADTGYRKLRSPSPPSPPENESYDPFDPTESPDHKSATSQLQPSLDIPLPDRNDDQQNMKPLENIEEKPMMAPPPLRFPQHSFDQSNACSFVPRGSLPNVHIPPPNFIIHNVPRPPFGNMVPQPNIQPFNWPTPPPTILVPPVIRGPFIPPPLPPRMITPQCAQPQMGCLPPHGPPPGPLPVMTPRGMQNSGPFVPNLPPPPMQNLNLPPQIPLTNIAHPPPPPPQSSMMTSTVQNSAPLIVSSHPLQNAVLPRPLFIPPTTTVANPPQDSSLPVTCNQVLSTMNSPLAVSSSTSVQSTDFSNAITAVTVPTTNAIPVMQSVSKKSDTTILHNTTSTTSDLPKKQIDSETTNRATAPSDVTDIVDMEVDSPFSPTNSPIDFDDVSIASSSEKSTPSPIGRELILSSPRPKFLAAKQVTEISAPKSSTPLKTGNKSTIDLTITENSKSNKIISCGQSLLEEVWAKHILSDSSSKTSTLDPKKKPSEKIRVVRDVSVKEALKVEGSSFKMDEDQLKILDEIPSSAVEMQVKEKYMKKLNRQERVIEEVKLALKPYYNRRDIDKEEYKEILRKCVPKICHNRSGSIVPKKVKILVEAYVEKFSYHRKKGKDKPFPNT